MTPATQITVRFRADGHARFQLPEALCDGAARTRLYAALRPIEGVYRVDHFARQRKLSVRFNESLCSFESLLDRLQTLAGAETSNIGEHACCGSAALEANPPDTPAASKPTAPRRPGTALGLLAGRPKARSGMIGPIKETTLIEFFNDALVLFLIKLHWHMITQHWLRQPWRFRYEWMAAIYLIYLLVRSRRPKT